jgi:hypothetical protein
MGSRSGGGSAGKVDYPEFMKDTHSNWLAKYDGARDYIDSSVVDNMNTALATSPFAGLVSFSPDEYITILETAVSDFKDLAANMSIPVRWSEITAAVVASTGLANSIQHHIDDIDTWKDAILGRLQGGIENINYAIKNAYTPALQYLDAACDRLKLAHSLPMYGSQSNWFTSRLVIMDAAKLEFNQYYAAVVVESERIGLVARREEVDATMTIAMSAVKWNLEVFQYGANLMAGIRGRTLSTGPKTSKIMSGLGGAMAGASMGGLAGASSGAIIGSSYPVIGTIIGAIIGFIVGYFSA